VSVIFQNADVLEIDLYSRQTDLDDFGELCGRSAFYVECLQVQAAYEYGQSASECSLSLRIPLGISYRNAAGGR
jgi:hypothetical protein